MCVCVCVVHTYATLLKSFGYKSHVEETVKWITALLIPVIQSQLVYSLLKGISTNTQQKRWQLDICRKTFLCQQISEEDQTIFNFFQNVYLCVLAHLTINVMSRDYLCPSSFSVISSLMEDNRDYILLQAEPAHTDTCGSCLRRADTNVCLLECASLNG